MPGLRFSLRNLLLAATVFAIGVAVVVHYVEEASIYDTTDGAPPVCGVHNLPMTKKLVGLTYGMRAWTPLDEARGKMFPHADEVYDTGFCCPLHEERARVYVCTACTAAREKWLRENP